MKGCSGRGLTVMCGGSVALYETALKSSGASLGEGSLLGGYTRMMDIEGAAIV